AQLTAAAADIVLALRLVGLPVDLLDELLQPLQPGHGRAHVDADRDGLDFLLDALLDLLADFPAELGGLRQHLPPHPRREVLHGRDDVDRDRADRDRGHAAPPSLSGQAGNCGEPPFMWLMSHSASSGGIAGLRRFRSIPGRGVGSGSLGRLSPFFSRATAASQRAKRVSSSSIATSSSSWDHCPSAGSASASPTWPGWLLRSAVIVADSGGRNRI